MGSAENVSFVVAFTAGLMSFLSPCVLPLLPSYVSFITGMSFEEITGDADKKRLRRTTAVHAIFFIIGFSLVFVSLGASATYLGNFMNRHLDIFQKAGGSVVILLGVHFTGMINLNFLQREKRVHLQNKPIGYLGSTVVGISFAAGWTPCIGPILAAILMYATTANNTWHGMALLSAYSLGLGIPFFFSSIAIHSFLTTFKRIAPYMKIITVISGVILIGVGLLIFTSNFDMLSQYATIWFND